MALHYTFLCCFICCWMLNIHENEYKLQQLGSWDSWIPIIRYINCVFIEFNDGIINISWFKWNRKAGRSRRRKVVALFSRKTIIYSILFKFNSENYFYLPFEQWRKRPPKRRGLALNKRSKISIMLMASKQKKKSLEIRISLCHM